MPHTSPVSTRFPSGAVRFVASTAGLLLAAVALAACGSTPLPTAGDCVAETATVSDDAPTIVDCGSDDARSEVVAVDDDPPDHADPSGIAADLCEGHADGEVYVLTETEKKKGKKGKKGKKRKTVTENDWAACLVKV